MPTRNLQRLAEAVRALGPLAHDVCFVGGSIVELLVTDAAARRFRPTLDVDVMPSDARALGFTNRWYGLALSTAWLAPVDERTEARVATAPCFIATKLEAFAGRGSGDYAGSHDIEDLLTVVDGRPELLEEVEASPDELRDFLARASAELLRSRIFLNVYEGHLEPGREPFVRARLERLASL